MDARRIACVDLFSVETYHRFWMWALTRRRVPRRAKRRHRTAIDVQTAVVEILERWFSNFPAQVESSLTEFQLVKLPELRQAPRGVRLTYVNRYDTRSREVSEQITQTMKPDSEPRVLGPSSQDAASS